MLPRILICWLCLAFLFACSDTKKYAAKEGRLAVFEREIPSQARGSVAVEQSVVTSDWQYAFVNMQNALPNLACDLTETTIWHKKVGKKGYLKNRAWPAPVVIGDMLYVLDGMYSLTKVDRKTGEIVWQKQLDHGKTGLSLGTNGEILIALSQDGVVTALDMDGKQAWQQNFNVETRAPLLIDKKTVYLITTQDQFIVLNAKTGKEIWRYQTTKPQTWLTTMAPPAKANNVVVVPFATGEVIAFEADSGLLLWIQTLIGKRPQDLMEVPQITAAPVIEKGVVYLTGNANLSGAYNLKTGEKLWTTLFSSSLSPIVSGNTLFMITKQNALTALDKGTGKIFWQKEISLDSKRQWQALFLMNDEIVLSDGETLRFMNPKTGEFLRARKEQMQGYPIVVDRHLIKIEENANITHY